MIEIYLHEAPPPDPHDHNHPDNERNLVRAAELAFGMPPCPICGKLPSVVAGPSAEWVIDHTHEPGCREGEDPEAYEVNVTGGYDPALHRTVEAIWSAGEEPPSDDAG